ncbi:MAG: hypothetical protein AABX98_03900, partial [Nanoarchaeota archaeon]
TPDTLQESIENGTLLGAYDLLREQNIERYHPNSPRLQGAHVPAADPVDNVEHDRVAPLTPADAKAPNIHYGSILYEYIFGGFARVIGTSAEMRDVAKGLVDLNKHAQYIQATQHRRLTDTEAAADIDQYQTTAARRTLEQLTCDLEYVANVATVPAMTTSGMGTRTIVTKVDPNAIQAQSKITGLAAMPDAYKGLIQEGVVLTAASMSPLGVLAGYGLFKGAGFASRFVSDIASYTVRQAGSTYSNAEDGWKNGAEAIGSLAGLGAFGVALTLASGGLAFGVGTALVAGGVGYTYFGKKRRQEARDVRRDLEHALQTGANPAPHQTRIDSLLADAKRYERNSSLLKLASLVSLGLGVASHYGAFGSSGTSSDTEAPKITRTEFNDGSTTHTFNKATTPTLGFEIDATDNKDIDKITAYVHKVGSPQAPQVIEIYPDNGQDNIQHALGMNTIKDGGEISLAGLSPGDYIVNARATDFAGHSSLIEPVGRFTVVDGSVHPGPVPPGPTPPGPVPPSPTPGPSPIPGTTDYAEWDIRRTYDDHGHLEQKCNPSSYTGAAAHENALSFDAATRTGTVQFDLTKGDTHTAGIDNIAEDTRVFFEGYKNGKLEDAILVNIDASGKFDLSAVDLTKYDGYQVWWAEVNMNDAASKTLCVEALASVSVDNNPNDGICGYIVEKEEACHSGGHGSAHIFPPRYEPSHFVCEPGDFKFHFNGLTHYPTIGDEAHFMARGMGGGMLYTLETPGSYNLYQVGPGAICVEDNILLPHEMSWLRLDGVDLATGTRDTFGFGNMHHTMSFAAPDTHVSIEAPLIPRPVPGMGEGVDNFGYNPFVGFEPEAPAADVPQPVPTMGTDVNNFGAQPFQDLDLSANTPYLPQELLYIDDEAIAAFLREQYKDIDYKQVA